jgi:hypothetical protein
MNKIGTIDQIVERQLLFKGPWSLERVGHEQWVLRGVKEDHPALFKMFEKIEASDFSSGKCEFKIADDLKLVLHEGVEHVQLRIYSKERIQPLLTREIGRLRVKPESIQKVKDWIIQATKAGVTQLGYLKETLGVFEEA